MRHVRYHVAQGGVFFLSLLIWILYPIEHFVAHSSPTLSSGKTEEITATDPSILRNIQVIYQNDRWHVVLTGSASMTYEASKKVDPLRLTIDLPNAVISPGALPRREENEIIGRIRGLVIITGRQPLTRIHIDLNRDVHYVISKEQERVWVSFDTLDRVTGTAPVKIEPTAKSKAGDFRGGGEAAATGPIPEAKTLFLQTAKKEQVRSAREIRAIKSIKSDEELRIYILADGSLAQYDTFFLDGPPRLVLDIKHVKFTKTQGVQSLQGAIVRKIRVGLHPGKVRVVFDLVSLEELSYEVILANDRLVVSFKSSGGFPSR